MPHDPVRLRNSDERCTLPAMTVVLLVLGAIASGLACNYIGKQKGRSGVVPLGVLLGAIGLLIVAFMKPAPNSEDPEAPQRPQGRLDWLSHSGGRAWTSRPELLWSVVVLAVSGFAIVSAAHNSGSTFDRTAVEQGITSGLDQRGVSGATVSCPDKQPLKAGYIFDCDVSGTSTLTKVRVTEDDNQGHFTWMQEG